MQPALLRQRLAPWAATEVIRVCQDDVEVKRGHLHLERRQTLHRPMGPNWHEDWRAEGTVWQLQRQCPGAAIDCVYPQTQGRAADVCRASEGGRGSRRRGSRRARKHAVRHVGGLLQTLRHISQHDSFMGR